MQLPFKVNARVMVLLYNHACVWFCGVHHGISWDCKRQVKEATGAVQSAPW